MWLNVAEVPQSRLLPAGWDEDPTAVSLTYRHPTLRGNVQFTLSCVAVGDSIAIHLTKTGGELHVMEVPAEHFVHIGGDGSLDSFSNLEVCLSGFLLLFELTINQEARHGSTTISGVAAATAAGVRAATAASFIAPI